MDITRKNIKQDDLKTSRDPIDNLSEHNHEISILSRRIAIIENLKTNDGASNIELSTSKR